MFLLISARCRLFYRYPNGLATLFRFYDFVLYAVQPFARIQHFPHFSVLTHKDAPLGVLRRVPSMYADAAKVGHTE